MKLKEKIVFSTFFHNFLANKDMDIQSAYKISKIYKAIEPDVNFYHQSLRAILDDCVEVDDNGNFVILSNGEFKLKQGKESEFQIKIHDLENLDVEYDTSLNLDIKMLGELKISPHNLLNIINFLK